jgi:hypothetical protein
LPTLIDELAVLAARVQVLARRIDVLDPSLGKMLLRYATTFTRSGMAGMTARGADRGKLLTKAISAGRDTVAMLHAAVGWAYVRSSDVAVEVGRIDRVVGMLAKAATR